LQHPLGARFLSALQARWSHSNSTNTSSTDVWLDPLSQTVKHFDIASRICAVHRVAARQPVFAPLPALNAQIQHTLSALQIDPHKLYSHQSRGVEALLSGSHLALSTSTASGKSLVYNLFALHLLLQNNSHRIILVFPTKSLAHDQLRSLNSFMSHVLLRNEAGLAESIQVSTLDGDTPIELRSHILARSHIILTNPDMLHVSILPHHHQCSALLSGLRFVVFDESHVYRGAFGVHVACIIRRLRRIHALHCATNAPGTAKLQFMTCSATLQNVTEHFHTLTGVPVEEGLVTLTEVLVFAKFVCLFKLFFH
jgi:DEAD/DEAH box helicase domain-containing protein